MKKILFLYFAILSVFVNAQNIDSLIRYRHPELNLSNNFHLFTYPLYGATTTFAPQAIKGMKELTMYPIKKCNEDILFVFDNRGGIAEKQIDEYFRKVFLWNDWQIKQIKYVIDNEIFHIINNGSDLIQQMFFFNGKEQYNKFVKHHTINQKDIQHNTFSIVKQNPIKITKLPTILQTKDKIISINDSATLLNSDIEDRLLKVSLNTGEVLQSFSLAEYDNADLFCRYIANGDTAKCDFAKKYNRKLKDTNRKTIDILATVQYGDYLYCSVSLEVYQENKEKYEYINDEGEKISIPIGKETLTPYLILLKLDNNFKILDIKKIDEEGYLNVTKDETYFMFDLGFRFISPDTLIAQNTIFSKQRLVSQFSLFSMEKNELKWLTFLPNKIKEKTVDKKAYNNIASFYTTFNGKTYFSYDCEGESYCIEDNKVASKLSGDGIPQFKKEKYMEYAAVTVKGIKENYDIHAVATIQNGEYLAYIYDYQKRVMLLEIKDKQLNTIDIIRIDTDPTIRQYFDDAVLNNMTIINDTIYFITTDGKDYYFNRYKITKDCPK